MTSEPLTLKYTPLHNTKAIGAEVEGLDFSQPIPDSTIQELHDAVSKYGILVFRKASLDNDTHILFSRRFGDLDDVKSHMRAGRLMRFPDQPEIFDVSNLNHKGEIVTSADPVFKGSSKGNMLWHADMAYNPNRTLYSLLRAVQLPPDGTGGETEFLDSRQAYEDLAEDLKNELDDLVCNNSLFHNRKLAAPDIFEGVEPLDYPMARYKLVQTHEPTDRKNLYVTTYTHHFDGQTMEQSRPLLEKLLAFVSQDKYKLAVPYHNNGDMIFWDNTAVLHRAKPGGNYDGKYVRDMRRTTVKDDGKFGWGENEVGTTWQAGLSTGSKSG